MTAVKVCCRCVAMWGREVPRPNVPYFVSSHARSLTKALDSDKLMVSPQNSTFIL